MRTPVHFVVQKRDQVRYTSCRRAQPLVITALVRLNGMLVMAMQWENIILPLHIFGLHAGVITIGKQTGGGLTAFNMDMEHFAISWGFSM